jgi:glycosyltransferase involved in cell wall biosynthesis
VAQLAHLRPVKDPLLAAQASKLLPDTSRIRIDHAGAALDTELGTQAARESHHNPRYRWHGDLSRHQALQLLSASRLLVLTSRHEGGANAISEALAADVPVLATHIPGTISLLGPDYPGYFPVADPTQLAHLLHRAETNPDWYHTLREHCATRQHLVDPKLEHDTWRQLLTEITGPEHPPR